MKPIAVIPARGGSKRIPGKNIREMAGQPVIARSICAALGSGIFESVFVSTDDPEIALIAQESGAEVPFLRPIELADDMTGTHEVIRNFVSRLGEEMAPPERLVCCVYATAVLLKHADFHESFSIASHHEDATVMGVTRAPFNPERLLQKTSGSWGDWLSPEHRFSRTQDLHKAYVDAGQLYWAPARLWMLDNSQTVQRYLFEIPRTRAVDIDDEEDWVIAEALLLARDRA